MSLRRLLPTPILPKMLAMPSSTSAFRPSWPSRRTTAPNNQHNNNAIVATDYHYEQSEAPVVAAACTPVPKYVHIGTRYPVTLNYCPNCGKQNITTMTRTKPTGGTWIGVLAGFVIFWPLFWLPLCIRSMKQTNHHCPNCRTKVGRVKAYH